ncbi:MAG: Holliday junction resolvase RuvX [Odoribacteraceae bacterium]|nr:Holliday junction resolvase RuvX [Odoribacteraceae bacterium]
MGRIIAIDHGTKRVGIAATDPGRLIANGLATVATREVIPFLRAYIARETVDLFVVGHPKKMDNSDSDNMARVIPFVASLRRAFPGIPVEMHDERFTSLLARRAILEAGARKKQRQDKALVDLVSAAIILQSYLEQTRNMNIK